MDNYKSLLQNAIAREEIDSAGYRAPLGKISNLPNGYTKAMDYLFPKEEHDSILTELEAAIKESDAM